MIYEQYFIRYLTYFGLQFWINMLPISTERSENYFHYFKVISFNCVNFVALNYE